MSTDLSVPCLRCSRPAAAHGEHHREHKGMGGRGPKAPKLAHERDALCRGCHDDHHDERFNYKVDDDGWITGINVNGTTFERPVHFDDASPSPACWTAGKLGEQWERADAATFKARATIAHVFKRRWGWGTGWARRAADAMGGGAQGTGQQISERTIRRAANGWDHWHGDWELMKQLGSITVAYAVAGAEDSDAALEIAQKQIPLGKKAGEIVAEIEGKTDRIGQTERCVCGESEGCGHVHTKKGE